MVRLQKYLASCGIASRRGSEEIIKDGRVKVNGETVTQMGIQIDEDYDMITVDDIPVQVEKKMVYILLNKPVGYVTTVSDDKERDTVMELVSDVPMRIYPVGRLDYDTEGLLLMTNDGDLTYRVTHPKNNVEKTYIAEVTGNINMDTILMLRNGVYIDGVKTSPAKVEVVGATQLGTKLEITIHEGKNRQIRRMFEEAGCIVKRLKRIREAGLNLGHVPLGRWRKLTESEVNMLKKIGTTKKSSRETSQSIFGKEIAKRHTESNRNKPRQIDRSKKTEYSGNGMKDKSKSGSRSNSNSSSNSRTDNRQGVKRTSENRSSTTRGTSTRSTGAKSSNARSTSVKSSSTRSSSARSNANRSTSTRTQKGRGGSGSYNRGRKG